MTSSELVLLRHWRLGLGAEIVLAIACIAVFLANPAAQEFMFNSDQLTVPSFVEDALRNRNFSLFTWMIPRAPYSFPDLPIYWSLRLILQDAMLAVFTMAFWHNLLLFAAVRLVVHRVTDGEAAADTTFFWFLVLCLSSLLTAVYSASGSMLLHLFMPIAHGSAAVSALLAYYLYESRGWKSTWIGGVALTALIGAAVFSDRLFVVFFLLPYFLLLVIECNSKHRLVAVLRFALNAAVGVSVALVAAQLLAQQQIDPIEFKLLKQLVLAVDVFRAATVPSIVLGIGLLSALLLGVHLSWGGKGWVSSDNRSRSMSFIIIMTVVSGGVALMLWKSKSELAYARYMVGFQLGGLVAAAMLLNVALRGKKALYARFAVIAVCSVFLFPVALASGDILKPIRDQREQNRSVAACKILHDLDNGYAQYWIARKLSVSTNYLLQVDQFEPGSPVPFFWGNNFLWFFYDLKSGDLKRPNFIIQDGFARKDVVMRYGEPSKEVDCAGYRWMIYLDTEELQRTVLRLLDQPDALQKEHFPAGFVSGSEVFGTYQLTKSRMQIGILRSSVATADSSLDAAGYLLYGPYSRVNVGAYRLMIEFKCDGGLDGSLFDVSAEGGVVTIASYPLGSRDLCDGSYRIAEIPFTLVRNHSNVEFRAFYGGRGSLAVRKLSLLPG